MEPTEYEQMEQVERTHWWHVGRLEILRRELNRRLPARRPDEPLEILNVGCGTGGTIRMLEAFGRVRNVDVSEHAISFTRRQGFESVEKVGSHLLPYPDSRFDVVAAFDVLEHIADDEAALAEWLRVLRPGGTLLLSVPAYQWLWSGHDVALHHHRRYIRGQISGLAERVGLEVVRISYAIVFSLPLVVCFRFLERLRGGANSTSYVPVPESINRLFTALLRLEARLHRIVRFPAGSSVLATLRKPRTVSAGHSQARLGRIPRPARHGGPALALPGTATRIRRSANLTSTE
jgi:SAM-dependent methyltransferase